MSNYTKEQQLQQKLSTIAVCWNLNYESIDNAIPADLRPHPDPAQWPLPLVEKLHSLAMATDGDMDRAHALMRTFFLERTRIEREGGGLVTCYLDEQDVQKAHDTAKRINKGQAVQNEPGARLGSVKLENSGTSNARKRNAGSEDISPSANKIQRILNSVETEDSDDANAAEDFDETNLEAATTKTAPPEEINWQSTVGVNQTPEDNAAQSPLSSPQLDFGKTLPPIRSFIKDVEAGESIAKPESSNQPWDYIIDLAIAKHHRELRQLRLRLAQVEAEAELAAAELKIKIAHLELLVHDIEGSRKGALP